MIALVNKLSTDVKRLEAGGPRQPAEAVDAVDPVYMEQMRVKHQLGDTAPVSYPALVAALEVKLQQLETGSQSHLWDKRQRLAQMEQLKKEQQDAAALVAEARRRQEMDREFLGSLQRTITERTEENARLREQLEAEKKRQSDGDRETQRELARVRRELDTKQAEVNQLIESNASDAMRAQTEIQERVEEERARTRRRDATIQKLHHQIAQEVGRREGIEGIYLRMAQDRLQGARDTLVLALNEIKRGIPNIPREVALQFDCAVTTLDLRLRAERPPPPKRARRQEPPPMIFQAGVTDVDYGDIGSSGGLGGESPSYMPE